MNPLSSMNQVNHVSTKPTLLPHQISSYIIQSHPNCSIY